MTLNCCTENLLGNLSVKEFRKSIYNCICRSYDQKSSALVFWHTVYSGTPPRLSCIM